MFKCIVYYVGLIVDGLIEKRVSGFDGRLIEIVQFKERYEKLWKKLIVLGIYRIVLKI